MSEIVEIKFCDARYTHVFSSFILLYCICSNITIKVFSSYNFKTVTYCKTPKLTLNVWASREKKLTPVWAFFIWIISPTPYSYALKIRPWNYIRKAEAWRQKENVRLHNWLMNLFIIFLNHTLKKKYLVIFNHLIKVIFMSLQVFVHN